MADKHIQEHTPKDLFRSKENEMEAEKDSFEEILKRLEEIVEKMESGGLALRESIELYKEGMKKIENLTSKLAEARDNVMKLVISDEGESKMEIFERGDEE